MISTPEHMKQVRAALGWSPAELARALRLAGGPAQGEKRVLEMESGRREISGPVSVAVESFLHGFLPVGFLRDEALPETAPAKPAKPAKPGRGGSDLSA